MSGAYDGVTPVEIGAGREGLWGIRNSNLIPLGGLITLRNATLEDHTWRKGGGAAKFGSAPAATTLMAGVDYWPIPTTQRQVVSGSNGSVYKDDGTGGGWVVLVAGLGAGGNPFFCVAGAESVGRNRKLFHCDGVNPVKVLSGDGVVMNTIASPPADWAGANQPSWLCHHQGRLWGGGNANDRHRLYASLLSDHEDFLTTTLTYSIFPGEGQYIACAISYKGGLLIFKYPEGVYFLDTSDNSTANWRPVKVGKPGAAGPANASIVEDDCLWVSPDAGIHAMSATQATGSVTASDISYRKLGSVPRDYLNADRMAFSQLVYYESKRELMLACSPSGQSTKTRRLHMDNNRSQDVGERWILWDRDQNESLWIKKDITSGKYIPAMGDNVGQVWNLDQAARNKDGSGYTFEFFMVDTDLGEVVPGWAGRWKNAQYLQIETDPRNTATLTIEVWFDGAQRQTLSFNLTGGGLVLPFTLPGVLGAATLRATVRRRMYGRFRRIALRGYATGSNDDVSITKLIIGCSAGE